MTKVSPVERQESTVMHQTGVHGLTGVKLAYGPDSLSHILATSYAEIGPGGSGAGG